MNRNCVIPQCTVAEFVATIAAIARRRLSIARRTRHIALALLAAGLAGSVQAQPASASMTAETLRCEYAVNPTGIDVAAPRLFWRVASAQRGQGQSAYEILVASKPEILEADQGDLWDSGRVNSAQTTQVRYGGAALKSSQTVFWKVRAWNREGLATPWSAGASWTMGLLQPTDWKGIWIAAPGATESLLLRREFTVRPHLRRALVHSSGLGQYELSFNGRKSGADFLSPGWSEYEHTALYETRDVTAELQSGRNAVGILLGNGIYDVVRRNRFVKFIASAGPLRAILHLRLEYDDGSVDFVGTDATWRVHAGPIVAGNIYIGEDQDARQEPGGWNRVGFDDRAWERAVPLVRLTETLKGETASAEPLREIEVRQPIGIQKFPDGSAVYDLGQNTSYIPRLRVSGPAGSRVRLTPSEVVNADGTINRSTMGGTSRGPSWWQYTKATDAPETWTPRFAYIGCRFLKAEFFSPDDGELPVDSTTPPTLEIAAKLPTLASLEGVIVHSSAIPLGSFSTSNVLLNRIRDLVRWAQCSNMVSVLTDCPHREKLGWLDQYHLNGPSIRYEFDVTRLFAKGENDMADSQSRSGLVPTTAPEYAKFEGAFRSAAEWGASFILVPWQQYQFTGDLDIIRTHFDAMGRYFAYLSSRAHGDTLDEGLGDWFDLGPAHRPGAAQLTPPEVTASAFFFYDASILARMAGLIGRTAEAKTYTARAEQIRASFNRRFYKSDIGSYATGSQCANALPLVLGIAEPAERPRVLAALVRDVEQHGNATTAGDVGFRFLLQALADGGRSDVIYKMINQDDKPGYGYQLKKGATSLTESWDANLNSSQNHFMLGQITEWMYKDLAGIDVDPTGAGFEKIVLHPQPVGDLEWVEASYNSIRGPISIRWQHRGNEFRARVTIPANTTATLLLPANDSALVAEGTGAATDQPGVTLLRREHDRAIYNIGSGTYEFKSQWTAEPNAAVPVVANASR